MIWAFAIGYVIGSLPSADLVGRMAGIDLRGHGSGNPGTANALRLGGVRVAATVLVFDLAKGAGAALAGAAVSGDRTAIAAAVAAIAAQIHNPWFGFRGGKGLGVAAGTLLILFPLGLAIALPITGLVTKKWGSGWGGLAGLACVLGAAIGWAARDLPHLWGVATDDGLVWYGIAVVTLAAPKFLARVRRRVAVA